MYLILSVNSLDTKWQPRLITFTGFLSDLGLFVELYKTIMKIVFILREGSISCPIYSSILTLLRICV